MRTDSQREAEGDVGFMLRLQRLAGNEAVASLIIGLQREVGGWTDADKRGKGWNVHSQVVEGTKINRIPVEGIKLGNQEAFYGKDKDKTTESATGKAVVLVPESLNPSKPIDVMLHLHGFEYRASDPYAGWRERSSDATVRDVAQDQIEQQMQAAGTTQVIGVLAQGIGESRFGKDKYNLPYNEYVREVLGIVAAMKLPQLPKVPDQYQLVLSAHSGGGITLTAGKKLRETENLAEIVLFDALNRPEHADNVAAWAEEHMKRVREAPADQRAKELARCPRLRAYYSNAYISNYQRLEKALKKSYEANPPELKAPLEARFALPHHLQGALHETVVRGLGDDPSAGPLADALVAIDNPEAKSKLLESKGKAPAPSPAKGAAPAIPAPANSKPDKQGALRQTPAGAITSERLDSLKTEEDTAFRKAVYDEQLRRSVADPKKHFSLGLPAGQVGDVDGSPISKVAESDAKSMLDAARQAVKVDRASGNAKAIGTGHIGVNNAYRSLEGDFKAWKKAYPRALDRTAKARKKLSTGPYSKEAVSLMVDDLWGKKAIPGFSNHTRGLAIDFETVQDGQGLGPTVAQKADWRKSWLYAWLVKHAATYGFTQLPTEEWHWDHKAGPPGPSGDEALGGGVAGGSAAASAPKRDQAAAARPKPAPVATPKPAPATTPAAVAAVTPDKVRIRFGAKARSDVVADSSLDVLRQVLSSAGLKKATITSTARSAEDQARAMYNNLIGTGKGQGVKAQNRLYARPGRKVIAVFVKLAKEKKTADEIQKGMLDKIIELGPGNVSRHCADPSKLNVIDIGPASLGDDKAQAALVAAAKAEEGKSVKRFFPYPLDPGDHFEIPPK